MGCGSWGVDFVAVAEESADGLLVRMWNAVSGDGVSVLDPGDRLDGRSAARSFFSLGDAMQSQLRDMDMRGGGTLQRVSRRRRVAFAPPPRPPVRKPRPSPSCQPLFNTLPLPSKPPPSPLLPTPLVNISLTNPLPPPHPQPQEHHHPENKQHHKRDRRADDKPRRHGFAQTERVGHHDGAGDDEGREEEERQDGVES